jgi:hypothetical protein
MAHELKVILGDLTSNTVIYINNEPINLIQDIKFHVGINDATPQLEIVFPNLMPFRATNSFVVEMLEQQIDQLKQIPNIKISLESIKFDK